MKLKRLNAIIVLLSTSAILSACGPQAFVPGTVSSNQRAGNMNIPPKVDIVMGISMNGTMKNIYPGIQSEIPAFVRNLETSGWDYRFVTIPLSEYFPGSTYQIPHAVSVSHYHTNYPVGQWLQPFPGALYTDPSLKLNVGLFSNAFVFPGDIDPQHNDGHETGIKNQVDFISRYDIRTQFLRNGALLALITVSNGEDRSGGSWVPAWNGFQWQAGANSSIGAFANTVFNIKGNTSLAKYYSLVAAPQALCRGNAGFWAGQRYMQMASAMGGLSVDICSNQLTSALGQVAQHLRAQKLNYVRKYIVVGTEPNVATIKVTKYIGGNINAAQVIPASAANGWTYIGYQSNLNTIESPVPMDPQSGYFIQLNGSAKLTGDDTANVEYTNAGNGVAQ